jgi:DNA-directed RNA polymerase alpha subunit
MDISAIISLIGGIVSIGSVITIIWVSIKKTPHETKSIDAEIMVKYAALVKEGTEQALQQNKGITDLEIEVKCLKKSLLDSEDLRTEQALTIDNLQDWADRLVHQVKSLGGTPVQMRKQKRDKIESEVKVSN